MKKQTIEEILSKTKFKILSSIGNGHTLQLAQNPTIKVRRP